jgi:hypothetical protein
LALAGGVDVLRYTQLPRHDVLHELLQFMARFLKPSINKLDPHIIHKATNELKVAEQYALRMLKMRNLHEDHQMDETDAKILLSRLVKDYPTHGFVISRNEAKELGLPVKWAEKDYNRWQQVKDLFAYSCIRQQTIVATFDDSDLAELSESIEQAENVNEPDENADNMENEIVEDSHEPRLQSETGAI